MNDKVNFVRETVIEQEVYGTVKKIDLSIFQQEIAKTLIDKAAAEQIVHDQNHRTILGGTSFWLHLTPDGGLMLCYDKHPSEWNVEAIKDTMDTFEQMRLNELGVHLFY